MKRLWTLEDIKGFIKRYSTGLDEEGVKKVIDSYRPKTTHRLYATKLYLSNSTFTDGRGLVTAEIVSDHIIQCSSIAELAKWMTTNGTTLQVYGCLTPGTLNIVQEIFAPGENNISVTFLNSSGTPQQDDIDNYEFNEVNYRYRIIEFTA